MPKNKMHYTKLLKIFLVTFVLFIGVALIQRDSPLVKTACAAGWGASCSNSYGSTYHICPRTGASFSGCIQSADFNVHINGTGIPRGQKFRIQIYPSDGSGSVCSDVTCLNRTADYVTPTGWDGSQYNVTLDQIGCSSGACRNDYTVKVTFAEPYIDPTLNCPNPSDFTTTIQNGVPRDANFNIQCQAPPPVCPVTKPVATITCDSATKKVACSWTNVAGVTSWNTDISKNDAPGFSTVVCRTAYFSGGTGTQGNCSANSSARTISWSNAAPGTYNCQAVAEFGSVCSPLVGDAASCTIAGVTPSPTPPAPTATTPPRVTVTPPAPTATRAPTNTPVPSTCPVPGTPVVTVTCIGCNNDAPIATPTNGLVSTPTPTGKAGTTPTPTVRITITPTPTGGSGNKDSGASCKSDSECKSGVCKQNANNPRGELGVCQ